MKNYFKLFSKKNKRKFELVKGINANILIILDEKATIKEALLYLKSLDLEKDKSFYLDKIVKNVNNPYRFLKLKFNPIKSKYEIDLMNRIKKKKKEQLKKMSNQFLLENFNELTFYSLFSLSTIFKLYKIVNNEETGDD